MGPRSPWGAIEGLDGRGCDASKRVSPVVSGRRQMAQGCVVLGSASTLAAGHADPGGIRGQVAGALGPQEDSHVVLGVEVPA